MPGRDDTLAVLRQEFSMRYDFISPRQIVFGWGRRNEAGQLARRLGSRAFVVTGSRRLAASGVLDEVLSSLTAADVTAIKLATISREPLVEDVNRTVAELLQHRPDNGDL